MRSSLFQHCFRAWDIHYQTDTRGNAYKVIFSALLLSSPLIHSLSTIIFRLCTGHCQLNHHLSRIGLYPDGLRANVKYQKRWNTLSQSAPNIRRGNNICNKHSINLVLLFTPRKSSESWLLQSPQNCLCESQAYVYRFFFIRHSHYKASQSESAKLPYNNYSKYVRIQMMRRVAASVPVSLLLDWLTWRCSSFFLYVCFSLKNLFALKLIFLRCKLKS